MGFRTDTDLAIRLLRNGRFAQVEDLVYDGTRQTFVVPAQPGPDVRGSDLASVPAVATAFVPMMIAIASWLLHDRLWDLARQTELGTVDPALAITYREADGLLRQALRSERIGVLQRWCIWAAVRLGALVRPGGTRDWWRDAPKVVGISLTAGLVFVAVPALVNSLFLWPFRGLNAVLSWREWRRDAAEAGITQGLTGSRS